MAITSQEAGVRAELTWSRGPSIRNDRVFDNSVVVGIGEVELIAMDFDTLGIIKDIWTDIRSPRPDDPDQGSAVLTRGIDHQNPMGILVGNNQPAKIVDVQISRSDKAKFGMIDYL